MTEQLIEIETFTNKYKTQSKEVIKESRVKNVIYPILFIVTDIIKVVALEGDKVNINKYVYINGEKQKNSKLYKKDPKGNLLPSSNEKNITIAKGYMFLLSDYNEFRFSHAKIGT